MTEQESLKAAISKIGGYSATARKLGLKTAWAVQKWKRCPAERVQPLVQACEGVVTARQLRPDLYPLDGDRPTVPGANKQLQTQVLAGLDEANAKVDAMIDALASGRGA